MALFDIEVASPNGSTERQVYVDLANQLLLVSTVMIVMHLIAMSSRKDIFNDNFLAVYLYVLVGVAYYHLLVKRLLIFV